VYFPKYKHINKTKQNVIFTKSVTHTGDNKKQEQDKETFLPCFLLQISLAPSMCVVVAFFCLKQERVALFPDLQNCLLGF
jgi:hypothetical protein